MRTTVRTVQAVPSFFPLRGKTRMRLHSDWPTCAALPRHVVARVLLVVLVLTVPPPPSRLFIPVPSRCRLVPSHSISSIPPHPIYPTIRHALCPQKDLTQLLEHATARVVWSFLESGRAWLQRCPFHVDGGPCSGGIFLRQPPPRMSSECRLCRLWWSAGGCCTCVQRAAIMRH